MKKTIKILVEKMDKLQEGKTGTLQGGFASVRGGFNFNLNFEGLTNSVRCTNDLDCSNTSGCARTTNSGGCVNSGVCFI